MAARKTQSRGEVNIKKNDKDFLRKQITMPKNTNPKNQVPARIIIVFIFALVFCLFSIYKVFIYGKGYQFNQEGFFNFSSQNQTDNNPVSGTINNFLWEEAQNISVTNNINSDKQESDLEHQENTLVNSETIKPDSERDENTTQTATTSEVHTPLNQEEISVLTNFYQALTRWEITEMNKFIHAPLRNSQTWKNHWNQKNIEIFRKNLVGELQLENLFLIPGSINKEKNTKQYSYTLNYTIQPNKEFNEDRKITLLTTTSGEKLISEIMCTTKGCSRSPFFRPQNYNLK